MPYFNFFLDGKELPKWEKQMHNMYYMQLEARMDKVSIYRKFLEISI